MNEITKAMIDVRRVLPKLKLSSIISHIDWCEIIFTTFNAVQSVNQACLNINTEKTKEEIKKGFRYVRFPQQYQLSISINPFIAKEIDIEAVNAYKFESQWMNYDDSDYKIKKCTCPKDQVLYRGCNCGGE